ncbi:uncharacterized protein LAESUDRAFT_725511 [Laetiporus sulphureus 93-53]|uniref:Copper transport protein n=1 Tax=Laetiporus sulphureus 93-53 TaxID=1314785 RepID=A0A165ECU9_9APHY|nr:uncharacterized protein LAESUDRAFT_725511 [Laetiporus sulphureus 93-53]KZT06751.1 hypothetical protein LAESUDRAFT_725511 [Laetiporus sulphureus 93-53]
MEMSMDMSSSMTATMASTMVMSSSTASSAAASVTSSSMSSMDMSSMGDMVAYLHFTRGDYLVFKEWRPSSRGAIAGACIALVAFSIFERWVAAMRSLLIAHWRRRALAIAASRATASESKSSAPTKEKAATDVEEVNGVNSLSKYPTAFAIRRAPRTVEPFLVSHDLPRGFLYAFHAMVAYVLMLAVMTFQAAYIISILIGLGIGEVVFGRMGSGDAHLLH